MLPDKNAMNVAGFFKELRKSRGLTQGEIAELLQVDRSYIGQLETGHYKKLPLPLLREIYSKFLTGEKEREEMLDLIFVEIKRFLTS